MEAVLKRMSGSAANPVSAAAATTSGDFDAQFVMFVSQADLKGGTASLG